MCLHFIRSWMSQSAYGSAGTEILFQAKLFATHISNLASQTHGDRDIIDASLFCYARSGSS